MSEFVKLEITNPSQLFSSDGGCETAEGKVEAVARLLERTAYKLRERGELDSLVLRDMNGNKVGTFDLRLYDDEPV